MKSTTEKNVKEHPVVEHLDGLRLSDASIQIFDGVGLDEKIFESAISQFPSTFSYFKIRKIDFNKITASVNGNTSPEIVLFVDLDVLETVRSTIPKKFNDLVTLVCVATPRQLEEFKELDKLLSTNVIFDILETPMSVQKLVLLLKRIHKKIAQGFLVSKLTEKIFSQAEAMKKLNDIGKALSAEGDINALLNLILTISRDITNCDSGSLYILQDKPDVKYNKHNYLENKVLCFKHTFNSTKEIPFKEFTMPISSSSLSGYTSSTGEILNLSDVYIIPEAAPYKFNSGFDKSISYRTKSMLVVPMLNQDKQTIGVLQLINKKRDKNVKLSTEEITHQQVIPFTQKDEELTLSFASQAAVAYENRSLYESIKVLFEGFIKASVTAIEARDPTTSGHSERVAVLSTGIAEVIDRSSSAPFKDMFFTKNDIQELKYASLLHDFGKIGVREPVLVKAKKLYEGDLELLKSRYRILRETMRYDYSKQKIKLLLEKSKEEALRDITKIDSEMNDSLSELDRYLEFIIKINEPTVLESSGFELLKEIQTRTLMDENKVLIPFLTPHEVMRLSIPKGSLGDDERLEIESHVTHTYKFLKQIPWTNDLRNVPEIAFAHHEKLDGSGYPQKLNSDSIPVQSKIMTISDIFDALTANDRPYKRAVPLEKALDILGYEVKAKKVDAELFKVFVEAKVFDAIQTQAS